MLDTSALQQFRPLIVTPSHDGKYFHNYLLSMLELSAHAHALGMPMQVLAHTGESLITRARNNCVATFLQNPQWTHLFWIDSDIGFSVDAALRLLLCDHAVAGGIYPLKREAWPPEGLPAGMTQHQFEATYTRYTVNTNADAQGEVHLHVDADGFFQVSEAPTGFMCIKREVFTRMVAHYPELQYVPDSPGVQDQGLHYRFFDVSVHPQTRRYLSEDYGFCKLWTDMGGAIHVDACSNLSHQGQKLYRGDFLQTLSTNMSFAVGAPLGAKMVLNMAAPLHSNPPGPQ